MTGFGFNSRFKIKKTDEFSSVFNFRKRVSGDFMSMHYMPNALDHPRIGLIVGKKTARLAVQRNYMKRAMRELFRQERHLLGGVDILLRSQKMFTRQNYAEIRAEFHNLLSKVKQRTGNQAGIR